MVKKAKGAWHVSTVDNSCSKPKKETQGEIMKYAQS